MLDFKSLDIKVTILSERKVRLDYTIDIICEEKIISSILIKVKYKISNGVYQMLYPKSNFINQLSNKLRVKKKFIHYGTIFTPIWSNYRPTTNKSSIEIEGMLFDNLIKSLYITDTTWFITWNRDQQLKNILK